MVVLSQFVTAEDLHDLVDALSTALDAKSSHTCGHSERVASLSLQLAQRIGLSSMEQERIHIGAHLHDIGKIGIPDAILNKPHKLTQDEFALMKQHPEIGSRIVGKVRVLEPVADIVRHHHERFDGRGYPDGLQGKVISIGARIVAVADSFDAMMSARPYRLARGLEEVLKEMQRCRGSQFDPDIVDALVLLVTESKYVLPGYNQTMMASARPLRVMSI